MRTGGEKVATSRTMPASNSFVVKTNANGDDPRVKAMWDEEFFGHELPPNYKISRVRTRDGQEPRKAFDGGCDVMEERALWDEFLGHNLPPNYVISRFQPPGGADAKGSGGRLFAKDASVGQGQQQQAGGSNRHSRVYNEDALEYNFDKTVDSYVLSEEISGPCKDTTWVGRKSNGLSNVLTTAKDEYGKIETFEERALRFGVEDWNLVGSKKWLQSECKGASKRSTRRGIFHSPSGSDTSSMISTLESSSFSCGSEGSSFAKTDFSSSSFNLSHVYPMPGSAIPFSAVGRQPSGLSVGRTAEYHEAEAEEVEPEEEEEQFVELNILDGEKLQDGGRAVKGLESKDGSSNYFEFNFLDGKMVESEDIDGKEDMDGLAEMKADASSNCGGLMGSRGAAGSPVTFLPAPTQSPDSDNFFDTSHDSDWSGTHSVSTAEHGLASARDVDPSDFDEDNASNFTDYRPCEDPSIDGHFYEADPPITPLNPAAASAGSKGQDQLHSNAAVKTAQTNHSQKQLGKVSPSAKLLGTDERRSIAKSPKKTPRKARSLGSVLSHHLAFTAVPSLRLRSQQALTSDQKQSPAKVTAACIEWLWSEKEAMKPVQALRALAERENAEKERIGSSPPVRNLDSAFKESRGCGVGKTPQNVSKALTPVTAKSAEIPTAIGTQKDPAKESRESILASWASVYGSGDSSSLRVRRPGSASKISLATPALRHCAKGAMSPRKRPISIAAQAGSKSAISYAKQPLPSKSLAVELEVLCRPFGPVLKGVRLLPTAKRGLGRPPLFSNLGPQLASSSSSLSTSSAGAGAGALPNALKCGRLQCVVSRDGLPSYSLIMEETEEIFAAKTLRVDAGLQDGVSHVYTFHSFKGKGKGRSGWRQWGKKEKPGSDFAGNMTVTSTICPVVSSNGVQNFVESEFVLFDAKVKEISISCPTSGSPYPRSSFSSWDTATPQRSPQEASSTYSSPSSTYFSLPSPNGGAFSTPVSTGTGGVGAGATTPTMTTTPPLRNVSVTLPGGVVARGSTFYTSVDKGASRFKQLERHLTQTTSPPNSNAKAGNFGLPDNVSDSDMTDDCESQSRPGWTAPSQSSQSELAAVVVRTPMEKTPGKTATVADKWGWGINFLRKSFDGTRGGSSPDPVGGVASGAGESPGSKGQTRERTPTTTATATATGQGTDSLSSFDNSADQRCGSCGSTPGDEQTTHGGGINITLILPSGEHGCSANGVDGPQPLIERWRSGGKCDCGSWDLGCGLTIVGNQGVDNVDNLSGSRGQSRDGNSALRMFVEGKKQQMVGLALTPLKEGCYTLGFQAPIAPLHAFATAVAVLHSRDPMLAAKKAGETKKRLTRIPVKVVPASSRSFSRLTEDPSGSKSFVSYKLVCPDPPASPFGRA